MLVHPPPKATFLPKSTSLDGLTWLSSRGATLVRISRIPPTIYTRPGADIIGHSEPVLQPSAVVTDLWQAEPNLRPPDPPLRIRCHTPRLLKAAGASRCGHLKCSCSFGSSTASCFRGGSSNSSQFL